MKSQMTQIGIMTTNIQIPTASAIETLISERKSTAPTMR